MKVLEKKVEEVEKGMESANAGINERNGELIFLVPRGTQGPNIFPPLLAVVCCLPRSYPCAPSLSVSLLLYSATPGSFGSRHPDMQHPCLFLLHQSLYVWIYHTVRSPILSTCLESHMCSWFCLCAPSGTPSRSWQNESTWLHSIRPLVPSCYVGWRSTRLCLSLI